MRSSWLSLSQGIEALGSAKSLREAATFVLACPYLEVTDASVDSKSAQGH